MEFHIKLNRYEGMDVTDQALVTIVTHKATIKAPKIETDEDAMNALCRAVARWIEGSEAGKEVWEDTCGDMNIADLQDWEHDGEFRNYLFDQGIDSIDISIDNVFSMVQNFTFDTILPKRANDFKDPEE